MGPGWGPGKARLTKDQVNDIEALLFKLTPEDRKSFLKWAGVTSVFSIERDHYGSTVDALKKKIASLDKLRAQLQASVAATKPGFDFDGFRDVLAGARSLDELNALYERELTGLSLTTDEADECDGILREIAAKFWEEDK